MKAAIVGGTGYGSIELIRLINRHPFLEAAMIISNSQAGSNINEIYPHLSNIKETSLDTFDVNSFDEDIDIVFLATPSGVSKNFIPEILEKGVRCIDLSGDFRLRSQSEYRTWYKHPPAAEKYLNQAVYGLSEIYHEKVKDSSLIANPGCYPTASLLGLLPITKSKIADYKSIIIDAKSGVSGAGRSLSLISHYAEINENIKAYKLGGHQHIPEIEQILTAECDTPITITFTTHLVPMTRGIMCTIYVNLKENLTTEEAVGMYKQFYLDHPFVRIRPVGIVPSTKEVLGSNYCDIGLHVDQRTGRLTIVSVIDNLVKGATGQAIQNANILFGWDVRTGLNDIPIYP